MKETIIAFMLVIIAALAMLFAFSIYNLSVLRAEKAQLKLELSLLKTGTVGGVVYTLEDGTVTHDILRRGDTKHIQTTGTKRIVDLKFFIENGN